MNNELKRTKHMRISEEYRKLNEEMHQMTPEYGANFRGRKWHASVIDLAKKLDTRDVLDYGCGKGILRQQLPLLDVKNYDPCVEAFAEDPKPADVVVCMDVMEHIELEYLDKVLTHIAHLTNRAFLVTVSLVEARKVLPDGRNTHLIVKPYIWWMNRFECMGLKLRQLAVIDDIELMAIYMNTEISIDNGKTINL
jgi:2-polyprenyl-3-methyl-5-hydroxy-6-metoxy-1,4-benzoquinol methylase